ncbi:hypothetical protein BH23CHL7_BH23CHL7_06690 [soil metagenome]
MTAGASRSSFPGFLGAWLALVAGIVAAIALTHRLHGLLRLLAAGVAVIALTTIPASFLGLASDVVELRLLRAPLGTFVIAATSIAAIAFAIRRGWRPRRGVPLGRLRIHPVAAVLGVIAVFALVLSAAVGMSRPPNSYDALAYHAPLSLMIWNEGALGAVTASMPGNWSLAHPGTAEIWFGLLRLAGGEMLANLAQLAFHVIGFAAVTLFARRLGADASSSYLAGVAFLLVPMVLVQAGRQLNDVAGAALVVAAAAVAWLPAFGRARARLAFGGLCLGLAVATKLAVLPAVLAVGLVMVLYSLPTGAVAGVALADRLKRQLAARLQLAWAAAAFLLPTAPWWLRNMAQFGNPVYPASVPGLPGVSQQSLGMRPRVRAARRAVAAISAPRAPQ